MRHIFVPFLVFAVLPTSGRASEDPVRAPSEVEPLPLTESIQTPPVVDATSSSGQPLNSICTSSVIWGDNYQTLHNLLVKHRSIRALHPNLPHYALVAEDVPRAALKLMEEEGILIKPIKHVDYTAENREAGFAKIMTKLRALELTEECEWVVQMDIDMVALRSIVDAVAECETGNFDLCGVPQSQTCSGRECCLPQANGNILHVLVVNTGFMVYRPGPRLRERLFATLEKTKAPREQTLWGQTICMNSDLRVHMLQRKFNIWTDLSWVPDIHVLHYGIGPAYLGNDMVPYTNSKFYEYHHGFEYYRRLSLAVDPCGRWHVKWQCGAHPLLLESVALRPAMAQAAKDLEESSPASLLSDGYETNGARSDPLKQGGWWTPDEPWELTPGTPGYRTSNSLFEGYARQSDPVLADFGELFNQTVMSGNFGPVSDDNANTALPLDRFYPTCVWKKERCIALKFGELFVEDQKDQDLAEIVDGNAALHCAIRDNPVGALRMINDCGIFCSYALHLEDYCDVNFSFFNCIGLILLYLTDYRSYASLWVGMWISCLPKMYLWLMRLGGAIIFLTMCVIAYCCWHLLIVKGVGRIIRKYLYFPAIYALVFGNAGAATTAGGTTGLPRWIPGVSRGSVTPGGASCGEGPRQRRGSSPPVDACSSGPGTPRGGGPSETSPPLHKKLLPVARNTKHRRTRSMPQILAEDAAQWIAGHGRRLKISLLPRINLPKGKLSGHATGEVKQPDFPPSLRRVPEAHSYSQDGEYEHLLVPRDPNTLSSRTSSAGLFSFRESADGSSGNPGEDELTPASLTTPSKKKKRRHHRKSCSPAVGDNMLLRPHSTRAGKASRLSKRLAGKDK